MLSIRKSFSLSISLLFFQRKKKKITILILLIRNKLEDDWKDNPCLGLNLIVMSLVLRFVQLLRFLILKDNSEQI